MAISNVELWNAVRKNNPSFAAHTGEATASFFTEQGWTAITRNGMTLINEFWELGMPYFLQQVNIAHAKDPLEENGFGEYYEATYGGYIQRMSIDSVKPVSPAYRNLTNGKGPDPFIVRKPQADERFFPFNFDYQSFITMPDEWTTRRIFISEFGFSEFLAGVFSGLENGYILQKYLNKLEVLNAAINDTKFTLQDSQQVNVTMSDTPTAEQLVDFQQAVMNTVEIMTTSAQTGAYNAMKFQSVQDKTRLHLLVRPGYQADLALQVVRGSYNADTLNLDVKVDVVPHFGGLKPFRDAEFTTPLYPVYSEWGEQIGWNTVQGASEVTVQNGEEFMQDPNADVYAVLADKGLVFETLQNPYTVEPIRNPRGLYTNYWANSPNNSICYDPLYNMVVFRTTAPAAAKAKASR